MVFIKRQNEIEGQRKKREQGRGRKGKDSVDRNLSNHTYQDTEIRSSIITRKITPWEMYDMDTIMYPIPKYYFYVSNTQKNLSFILIVEVKRDKYRLKSRK